VNESLLSTVFVGNYTPVFGWNTHTFQTPYNWDGQSNLVVDFCFLNNSSNNINPKMVYTATTYRSGWYSYSNNPAGQCGFSGVQQGTQATYASYFQRPNFKFNFCRPPLNPITWTPSTGPNGVTLPHADTTYSNPVNQTTYYVTLADTNGCSSRDYVTVFVDTAVQFSVTPDTFICSPSQIRLHANVTLAAGSNINLNSIVYTWTSRPASGTITGPNPLVTASVTTTYICTITGPGICPITDSATVTLGTGLPVNKVVDSISCANGSNGKININMNAGTAPYTYTWSPAAANIDSLVNLGPGTYYVTVTDIGGCIGHDTTRLVAPSPLALTFDSTNILCYNANTGSVTAHASGGRQPYRYTWFPAATNTNSLSALDTGTYQLTVTDTSGCTITGAVHITQPTQLVSSAISTSLSAAGAHDGTITVITSGGTPGYTYTSVPAVSGLPNATGLDTGIYYITVRDLNGCPKIDTVHVAGPPPIHIYFTVVNNLCHDSCRGTATASASGGVPPYTYNWTVSPTGPSLGTGLNITNLCAGIYRITVIDSNNISVFKDTVISQPTAIGMHIDSTNITCFGANNGTLHDSAWGGVGPYTIIWTPGGGDPLSGLSAGSYSVQVYDANQCPATGSATISEPAQVIATILGTDSVTCFGLSDGHANVQVSGGRRPYHYVWSGSTSVDSFAHDLPAGSGQTVVVTDASGCTASASFNIYQPTQIVISSVDTISAHCATSHDGSATAQVSGGSPGYTYTWDGATGANPINGLVPGNHNLIVTDSKGCTQAAPFVIDTQYVLHLSMAADSVTCNGGNDGKAFTTVINGYPTYNYSWSPASSNLPSVTGLAASTQTVVVTDVYGCTATGTIAVDQPNPISDQAFHTDPLCASQQNGKVWLAASGTMGPYTFTFNGAATIHPITDTIFNLGAQTYGFTITDGKGCTKTDSVTLNDPSQLLLPVPTATSITCANDANGTIQVSPSGGTLPYTYSWSPGGYHAAFEDSLGPATYNITVTDANGCYLTTTITLTAPPPISLIYLQADSVSCPDSTDGHIVIDPTGGTPFDVVNPYRYSIDGIHYFIDHNFYDLAAGAYTVYVMDSPGCIFTTVVNVYQPFPVTASINPQDSILALGSSVQLSVSINNNSTQSINSYTWSPINGLNCLDCPAPIASPFQTTTYYLTLNYGKNCTTTASDKVQVGPGPDVYIPNAFTPNGDGVNDEFSVFGTTLQSVGMTVFNRWGEKVFDSGESQWASWDGTFRGVAQPSGVYVFYVQLVYLDGKKKTREGSVTLIR
jgi:gliding motility-associated-like protein